MACNKDFEITKTWKEKGEKITSTIIARCTEGDFVTRLCPECEEKERDKIDTTQNKNIQREDVVCTACGGTKWTECKDGLLTCECGHEQEDN